MHKSFILFTKRELKTFVLLETSLDVTFLLRVKVSLAKVTDLETFFLRSPALSTYIGDTYSRVTCTGDASTGGAYIGSSCAISANTESAYLGGTSTKDTYIGSICSRGAYIESVCIGDTCITSLCIRGL